MNQEIDNTDWIQAVRRRLQQAELTARPRLRLHRSGVHSRGACGRGLRLPLQLWWLPLSW